MSAAPVPPRGRHHLEAAVHRAEPVGEAAQAGAPRGVRPAHAVVGDLHQHVAVVAHRAHVTPRGRRVLGDVRERLRDHVVGGRLHGLVEALAGRGLHLHRHRRALASASSAASSPRSLSTAGWMPRASSRSSSSAASSSAPRWPSSSSVCSSPSTRARASRSFERHRHEPLLGPVVEVALQPAPFVECRLHAAAALIAELLDLGAQLRVQPLVLQRERGRGAHRGDEVALVRERGVVHDGGHGRAVVLDDRGHPVPVRVGQLHGGPSEFTYCPRAGSQYTSVRLGSPSASASASRRPLRRASRSDSRATSSLTAPARESRLRSRPPRNAKGMHTRLTRPATSAAVSRSSGMRRGRRYSEQQEAHEHRRRAVHRREHLPERATRALPAPRQDHGTPSTAMIPSAL